MDDKKDQVEVVEWLEHGEDDDLPVSIGFMGGWFGTRPDPEDKSEFPGAVFDASHRWKDYLAYLAGMDEEKLKKPADDGGLQRTLNYTLAEYAEAIRRAVLKDKLRWTGREHQQFGTPRFSDGTVGSFTFRAWGDIMAAIWSEEEDKDYNYMNFYC